MKIKIVSDGTSKGTVVRLENGERLEQVTSVDFWADVEDEFGYVTIRLRRVAVEVEAEVDTIYVDKQEEL